MRLINKMNDYYYYHCDCYDSSVVISFTALSQNDKTNFILLTIFSISKFNICCS